MSPLNLITDKVIILLMRYIFHAQNHFLCYLYNFDWLKCLSQYSSPVNLILFCVKTYNNLQINCLYHLYLRHITGIYYYPS